MKKSNKQKSLSNVQMKIDNFSQKIFLKNNNKTNKRERNTGLNPKTDLLDTLQGKGLQSNTMTKNPSFDNLN